MFTFVLMALLAQSGDAPPANGSIKAVVHKRDKLPLTYPPSAAEVMLKDGAIHLTRQVLVYVPVAKDFAVQVVEMVPYAETIDVKVGDRVEKRQVTSYKPVTRTEVRRATSYEPIAKSEKQTIAVKSIKAFVVNKDGKLDALAGTKLLDMIAKPTRVLVGEGADIDPRHLELIRTGTIYLALPKATVPGDGPAERPKAQYEAIPLPKGAAVPAVVSPDLDARIELTLSSDVPLSIDGKKTSITGTRRIFNTPQLPPDKTFTYEFQVFWRSGQVRTFRVNVRAGQTTKVDVAESKE